MAKRVDHRHDATQELSTSQLVPDVRRPVIPRGKAPPNDASMWMQTVVSTDDFSPAARKAAPRSRRKQVLGVAAVAGALAMAAGTYVIVSQASDRTATAPAASSSAAPAIGTSAGAANPAAPGSAAPADPADPADPAAGAAAVAPAAVVAAPDAGVEAAAVPLEADAVSSVGAPILKKPATKKRLTKKRVTKKPTTRKRRGR